MSGYVRLEIDPPDLPDTGPLGGGCPDKFPQRMGTKRANVRLVRCMSGQISGLNWNFVSSMSGSCPADAAKEENGNDKVGRRIDGQA
jgi:hypothetical protein